MMTEILPFLAATYDGNFALAVAGAGSALALGMIGAASAQAVGRNPSAFGNILTIGIIGMALAEAVAIYAFIMALQSGGGH